MRRSFAAVFLSACGLFAQSGSPVTVTAQTSGNPVQGLLLSIQNASTTPVRGVVVNVQFFDPATNQIMGHFVQIAMKGSVAGQPQYISPSEMINNRRVVPLPRNSAGNPARYEINVDSVVFSDGTQWGPAKLPQSTKLRGMIVGADKAVK